jgi:hypothetical protein
MSGWTDVARARVDRFLRQYFDPLKGHIDDLHVDNGALHADIGEIQRDMRSIRDELRATKEYGLLAHEADVVDFARVGEDVRTTVDEVRGLRESTDTRFDLANMRLHQLLDEVGGVRESTDTRFDLANMRLHQLLDEVGGVRESTDTRFDLANMRLHQILDEVGGVRDRAERLEQRFGDVEANLVHQLEGQAQRQAELRSGLDEVWRSTKQAVEKLELLFMAQLEGLFGAVHSETKDLRRDIVELTRMLRMQGDAADQVAEVLGRTFTNLSEQVQALGEAVAELRAGDREANSPR